MCHSTCSGLCRQTVSLDCTPVTAPQPDTLLWAQPCLCRAPSNDMLSTLPPAVSSTKMYMILTAIFICCLAHVVILLLSDTSVAYAASLMPGRLALQCRHVLLASVTFPTEDLVGVRISQVRLYIILLQSDWKALRGISLCRTELLQFFAAQ